MDLAPLRATYAEFVESARTRTFVAPSDGGWSANQILGHVIVDYRDFAGVFAAILFGAPRAFDNRAGQETAYLDAVVRAAGSWDALLDGVRRGGDEVLDLLAALNEEQARRSFAASGVAGTQQFALDLTANDFAASLHAQHINAHRDQLLALGAS